MYFLLNASSIAEAAAVIPNRAKISFTSGTTLFINGLANLINKDPKTPPD